MRLYSAKCCSAEVRELTMGGRDKNKNGRRTTLHANMATIYTRSEGPKRRDLKVRRQMNVTCLIIKTLERQALKCYGRMTRMADGRLPCHKEYWCGERTEDGRDEQHHCHGISKILSKAGVWGM